MFISQNADLCRDGDRPIVLLVPPRQAADVTPVLDHLVHVGRGQLANVLRHYENECYQKGESLFHCTNFTINVRNMRVGW